MSGNVWVVNSCHRAVIIATEALDGTRTMSNHCENESTMRSFLWNILVNSFYLLVQGPLVNIQRTSDALGKGTGTDRRVSVISMSVQAIRALSKRLPEKCSCMCQIMWLKPITSCTIKTPFPTKDNFVDNHIDNLWINCIF